jgi:hypothetical protein
MFFKRSGVVVVYVADNHRCGDIVIGDRITQMGGQKVKTKEGFENIVSLARAGERVTMIVDYGPGGCTVIEDGNVGIEVDDVPSKSLKFGLDVYGGKRAWLFVDGGGDVVDEAGLESVRDVIEERARIWGASHLKTGIENGRLYVDVLNVNDVSPLLSKGVLEGRVEETIKISDGVGQIKIESEYYDIELPIVPVAPKEPTAPSVSEVNASNETSNETASNVTNTTQSTTPTPQPQITYDSIIVDGSEYEVGNSFVLNGVSFKVLNVTNISVVLSGLVFDNHNIEPSEFASSYIRYESTALQYQFYVPIDVSENGSAVFSKIVSSMPSVYIGGSSVLEGLLVFTIDGEEVNRLTMPTTMSSQDVRSLNIVGFASDSKEATIKKKFVEMSLAGMVDYDITIDETVDYRSGGVSIIYGLIGIVFGAAVILFVFPLVFYKQPGWFKMSSWSAALFLAVVFNIFGIAALSQSVFTPGWILDAVSVFGILVASVWTFVCFVLAPSAVLKSRNIKMIGYLDIGIFGVGFLLLFTQFLGFGIAIIVGVILKVIFTKGFCQKYVES